MAPQNRRLRRVKLGEIAAHVFWVQFCFYVLEEARDDFSGILPQPQLYSLALAVRHGSTKALFEPHVPSIAKVHLSFSSRDSQSLKQ